MDDGATFFIPPSRNVRHDDSPQAIVPFSRYPLEPYVSRWSSTYGEEILHAWKSALYARRILNASIGQFDGRTDLRGIPLAGADLRGVDLSGCDLTGADLSKTKLCRAFLEKCLLVEANLCGADLYYAHLNETRLTHAKIDRHTNLIGIEGNIISPTTTFIKQATDQYHLYKRFGGGKVYFVALRLFQLWRWIVRVWRADPQIG